MRLSLRIDRLAGKLEAWREGLRDRAILMRSGEPLDLRNLPSSSALPRDLARSVTSRVHDAESQAP